MARGVFRDLTGQKFGLWKALYRIPGLRSGRVTWVCICECGVTGAVQAHSLVSGRTSGCRHCGARRAHEKRRAKKN